MDKGRRFLKLLLIPSLLGLAVSLVLFLMLNNRQATPVQAAPVEMVNIVAAKGSIPPRVVLNESMLQIKPVPKTLVGSTEIRDPQKAVGQVTTVPLADGQVLLTSMLGDREQGLSYVVPKGKRAITLRVDELSGVAGYPVVGDTVDLIITLAGTKDQSGQPSTKGGNAQARLLVQNVAILARGVAAPPATAAKGQSAPAGGGDAKGVPTSYTLALTPQQALQVTLAQEISNVTLILRPVTDDTIVPDASLTDSSLFTTLPNTPPAPPPAAPAKP